MLLCVDEVMKLGCERDMREAIRALSWCLDKMYSNQFHLIVSTLDRTWMSELPTTELSERPICWISLPPLPVHDIDALVDGLERPPTCAGTRDWEHVVRGLLTETGGHPRSVEAAVGVLRAAETDDHDRLVVSLMRDVWIPLPPLNRLLPALEGAPCKVDSNVVFANASFVSDLHDDVLVPVVSPIALRKLASVMGAGSGPQAVVGTCIRELCALNSGAFSGSSFESFLAHALCLKLQLLVMRGADDVRLFTIQQEDEYPAYPPTCSNHLLAATPNADAPSSSVNLTDCRFGVVTLKRAEFPSAKRGAASDTGTIPAYDLNGRILLLGGNTAGADLFLFLKTDSDTPIVLCIEAKLSLGEKSELSQGAVRHKVALVRKAFEDALSTCTPCCAGCG